MSMPGVKFNDIHSYYGLNLILSQCSISPAVPKTNYIEIPGADGSIDLTEAHGEVRYKDRTGKLVFTVRPSDDFEEKKSEVSNLLNGKVFNITLDKDPDWYYISRCSISDWKCDKRIGQITVDLTLQPFKYAQEERSVHFIDPPCYITVRGCSVIPTITTKTSLLLYVNGVNYNLSAGTHKYLDICLKPGENKLSHQGGLDVTVTFRERSL